jgi:hypothetical protein
VAVIPTVSFEALAGTLPRTPLAVLPTPLVAAPRLAAALGTGPLLVKPDEDGGTVDILPRLMARDSTYYADWSTR